MGEFFTSISEQLKSADVTPIQGLLNGVFPIASWILRVLLIALGLAVLIRCLLSLFQEKHQKELWGTLTLSNGTKYELNHWENVIGRSKSSDVVLDFPSISRNHAAIQRDDKGNWKLIPLQSKNGCKHNGIELFDSVPLEAGDLINLGGLELYFYPVSAAEEQAQSQKRGVIHRKLSPHKTLGYLSFMQALMLLYSMLSVKAEHIPQLLFSFALLCASMWCLYVVYRAFQRTAFEAETLVFFLCTLSFGLTSAYSPKALLTQTVAVILGILLFFALSLALRDLKMAVSLRWPMAAFAGVLLSFNLLFGQRIFGAKNWMAIGPLSFQPSEFIKIAFIIASAATLDRLFAKRNLIFTTLFAGFCVGCLALMSDFGTALIFFVAFLVVAFLRSGDLGFLLMMGVGAGLGCGIILHFKPYVANRFEAWRHVWDYASTTGYQQTRTLSAIASGGLFGKAPDDVFLKHVGAANTDLVFGVVSEEFGLILAVCAVISIVALAIFSVKSAGAARSSFYTIVSCTAAAMLTFQTCLNVFGSVDLLPLTGVTFPFLSVGGSSMISCWGLLAFIKSADTRPNASFTVKRPKFRKWSTWEEEDDCYEPDLPFEPEPDSFWEDDEDDEEDWIEDSWEDRR